MKNVFIALGVTLIWLVVQFGIVTYATWDIQWFTGFPEWDPMGRLMFAVPPIFVFICAMGGKL